ncbi:hypothetical protein JYG33_01855 [Alcaligenes sp. SORT26]|uniref:hypothetical protein n=1 Tax=Alcaligenes sp. SORT26 TaxID=2813780 RepID=UPI001A9DA686|nr:hypothetical protein [Alcaligenes sp. SORT26]QTC00242.1 hypothetical protein JYG33_01855 [Alcaligenes sp. SORT26]
MFGFDAIEGHCSITFYNENGEITGSLSGPPGIIEANKELSSESWVEGKYSDESYYVIDGAVKAREEMKAVLHDTTLRQLPMPCEVFINQSVYKVEDGAVELVFDQPGLYKLRISAWPFLDKEFEIEN